MVALLFAAIACAFPVDVYILDTGVQKEYLLGDYLNANLVKYDTMLMRRIWRRMSSTPPKLSLHESNHGTDIAALILNEIVSLRNKEIVIYDVPVASNVNHLFVDDNLLYAALCELNDTIHAPATQQRHTVLVLSFSIELKNIRSLKDIAMKGKMTAVITSLLNHNVHILAAAGNENAPATQSWPATIEGVYSVGGLQPHPFLWSGSFFRHHLYQRYASSNYDATFYDLASNIHVRRNGNPMVVFGTSYANAIAAGKVVGVLSTISRPIHPQDTLENKLMHMFLFDLYHGLPMLPTLN